MDFPLSDALLNTDELSIQLVAYFTCSNGRNWAHHRPSGRIAHPYSLCLKLYLLFASFTKSISECLERPMLSQCRTGKQSGFPAPCFSCGHMDVPGTAPYNEKIPIILEKPTECRSN